MTQPVRMQPRVPATASAPRVLNDCPTCGGAMYRLVPHPDARLAARGATVREACPACNLAEVPACPTCGDMGMIVLDVPLDDPRFGKPIPCPANCAAVQRQQNDLAARLLRRSQLPDEYRACSFHAFDALPAEYRRGKDDARRAAQYFVEAAPGHFVDAGWLGAAHKHLAGERRNWLIFTGLHGLGKTGMAASITNTLVAQGRAVLYIRLQDAFTAIQRRYREEWEQFGERDDFESLSSTGVLDEIKTAPVLVLDEWFITDARGKAVESPDKRDKLEAIMRYRHANHLPTVITTNYTLDVLETAWGTTTLSVVRRSSFVIPFTGQVLRPVEINIGDHRG